MKLSKPQAAKAANYDSEIVSKKDFGAHDVLSDPKFSKGGVIPYAINEADLERILRHPATMIGSDGEIPVFGKDHPHPRSYGTFVRVHYTCSEDQIAVLKSFSYTFPVPLPSGEPVLTSGPLDGAGKLPPETAAWF